MERFPKLSQTLARATQRLEHSLLTLADGMLRHPWRVLLVAGLLTALCGSGLHSLAFSMDYRSFFDGDDLHVAAFDRLQRTYTKSDSVLFVLAPKHGDVFTRNVLATVEELTTRGWKLPFATRVDSLTNFQHSGARGDDLSVSDLVRNAQSMTDAQLQAVRHIALTDELMLNRLIAPDGRATAVNVSVRLSADDLQRRGREVAAAARALGADLRRTHPELNVYMSGTLMINDAFYEVAKRDLLTLIPAMFVVLVVTLAVLLRSVAGSAATFAIVGASNAIALGTGTWLGIKLTPPSAAAAPIVMTLAIAGCVHLFTGYSSALRENSMSRKAAMLHSLRSNFTAMILTTVTTFVGFWTMNFTPSPPFHDLGNLVLIGITAAYLLSVTAFPALIMLLPAARHAPAPTGRIGIEPLIDRVIKHRTVLLWSGIVLTAAAVVAIPRNELDDEFLKYFDRTVQFRVDNDFITDHLTGVYQIEYSINAAGPEGITDPAYLRTLDEFKRWFLQQPAVWHVDSVTDILKRVSKNLHHDDPAFATLPQTQEEGAQYLLLYGMSLPVGLDLNDRINVDKSATRFTVTLHTISANQMIALEEAADRWLKRYAPAYMGAIGTGPAIIFAHIGANSIYSGIAQELAAMGIISALMMLVTRSIRIGSLTMVPNLVPAAMAFGVWGLIDGRVNMALSTVVGMTLGIVVDDTIHLLHRYLHARRHDQATAVEAIRHALSEVGVAVAITSAVLIAGFLVLTLSPFVMNWGMGLLTAITLVFAMIVEFLMLPALLLWADRDKRDRTLKLKPSAAVTLIFLALACGMTERGVAQSDADKGREIAAQAKTRDSGFGCAAVAVTMTLTNAQGEKSVRKLRARIFEGADGEKRLFLFDEPRDVRGTAMLAFTHRTGADDLWMYLPAISRVKRITSNNKSGPFMGSEFAYEDLGSQEVEKFNYRYLREESQDGADCFVIERHPLDPDSGYARQILWVDKSEYRPRRVEYYDRKDALLKVLTIQGYRLYQGRYWRPDTMLMSNVQTRKETLLEWTDYDFQTRWGEHVFDPQRLADLH